MSTSVVSQYTLMVSVPGSGSTKGVVTSVEVWTPVGFCRGRRVVGGGRVPLRRVSEVIRGTRAPTIRRHSTLILQQIWTNNLILRTLHICQDISCA